MKFSELSNKVIGCAIEVHKALVSRQGLNGARLGRNFLCLQDAS